MYTKTFIVRFRCDESTKWKYDDSDTCYQLAMAASCVGSFQTNGAVPEVVVATKEQTKSKTLAVNVVNHAS